MEKKKKTVLNTFMIELPILERFQKYSAVNDSMQASFMLLLTSMELKHHKLNIVEKFNCNLCSKYPVCAAKMIDCYAVQLKAPNNSIDTQMISKGLGLLFWVEYSQRMHFIGNTKIKNENYDPSSIGAGVSMGISSNNMSGSSVSSGSSGNSNDDKKNEL